LGEDPLELVARLNLDRSVPASPTFKGGQSEARKRLNGFVLHRIDTYDVDRNRSDIDGTTTLSPYLHFGHISPVEVAVAALQACRGKEGPALDSFFNELIVQRELCINFALHEPHYDAYEGIPEWGRASLDKHRTDPRPVLYTRSQMEESQTADLLWNAAQLQMVHEGFMPNRLRMYWAKQILRWSRSPEEAFATAVYLNDRYFLDGRDPNGYAGIAWSIGGRHDRPFPPNKPIFGLVRPMGMNAMRKSFDTDAYIAAIEQRYGARQTQPTLFRLP
jgi:deoxyribodipyrimidine photo-lyase